MPTFLENYYLNMENRARMAEDIDTQIIPPTLKKVVAIGRDKDTEKCYGSGGRELLDGILRNFFSKGNWEIFGVPQTLTGFLVQTRQDYSTFLNDIWVAQTIACDADWLMIFHPDVNKACLKFQRGAEINVEVFKKAYPGDTNAPTYREVLSFITGGFTRVERADGDQTELSRTKRTYLEVARKAASALRSL